MFNDEKSLRLQVSWQRIKDQVAPSCSEYAWKVRQRMAHDTNPLWNRISDTVEAQAFADDCGAKTLPALGTYQSVDDIDWENLPTTCFLRGSQEHSTCLLRYESQWFLYGNGDAFCDKDGHFQITECSARFLINDKDAKTIASMWLTTSARSKNPAMNSGYVDASIVVEPFLLDDNGQQLVKYRVYCFDGIPELIELISPTITRLGGCALYTPEWTHVRQTVPVASITSVSTSWSPKTDPPSIGCCSPHTAVKPAHRAAVQMFKSGWPACGMWIRLGITTSHASYNQSSSENRSGALPPNPALASRGALQSRAPTPQ